MFESTKVCLTRVKLFKGNEWENEIKKEEQNKISDLKSLIMNFLNEQWWVSNC